MSEPLLIDIGEAPHCCADHALEGLYKALADRPDETIWEPHHDPFVRDHIENVTARGLGILEIIAGMVMSGLAPLAKAIWMRPDDKTLDAMWVRLREKRAEDYTLDDWLVMIDYALGRYLPDDAIRSEADYLAVRAVFAGRIQAALAHPVAAATAANVVMSSPIAMSAAVGAARWAGRIGTVLDFARQRAADLIVDLRESTRRRLRSVIREHEERRALGEPATSGELQTKLLETFGELNRDWRRIAVTEVGRNANEGFVASLAPGSRVKRLEMYATACPFCRRIHGMEFEIVDPAKPNKGGWSEVWPGKSNVGRSASPRKRGDMGLVERLPSELWWPAAGVQHPHCRGTWTKVENLARPDNVDPRFDAWLKERLKDA